MTQRLHRIGLISDTHGLLRPEALRALQGSEMIVHAGDVGRLEILERLSDIAPVIAVRGNNDQGAWAASLRETEAVAIGAARIYVVHDLAQLAIDPAAAGFHAVVSGHSHRPVVGERAGVVYVNPGSAGPRRFTLPVSVGELVISGATVRARVLTLQLSG